MKVRWRKRTREAAMAVVATVAVIAAPALPPLAKNDALPHNEKGQAVTTPSDTPVVGGSAAAGAGGLTADWVKQENAKPGTADWRLNGTSGPKQIEAYAGAVSAAQGDTVEFYVSTVAQTFHLEAYRMGFYGGLGGRLVWRGPEEAGEQQSPPTVARTTNMVEAGWKPSAHVQIDAAWVPGMYLVKAVGDGNQQYYVPLTIRDDASRAAYLVQSSVTTWQAYNDWGGYDLYEGKSGRSGSDFEHRSRIVSFDRPYDVAFGASDFLGLEYPLVSLLESLGLDVSYTTDVDVHAHPDRLLQHRAVLSLGHDEYWSTAMRDGAERARDAGVNLVFFGANAAYRHIRFESSPLGADRREVDYKSAHEDPVTRSNKAEATVNWRDPPNNRPESQLIGDLYECNPVKADMVIADAGSWFFGGTGVHEFDRLSGVIGSEYDRVDTVDGPQNVQILAHSPLTCHGKRSFSDMTYYTAASGAGVWATGTINWIAKLGSPCIPGVRPCLSDVLARVTENVLQVFGAGPAGRVHPSIPTGAPKRVPPASTSTSTTVSGAARRGRL